MPDPNPIWGDGRLYGDGSVYAGLPYATYPLVAMMAIPLALLLQILLG